ncbi:MULTISPECIES: class I SAM-dependent methyltransferase [Mycobacteriaceae]|uniref:S-adenosyl-L-methionine-dependent methyltransferase n=1 Tax=Mycolicibacterium neoaurum VKM Ac-1815D TaxID=700508 RepID=V5X766_MYCNE|nr:MULTISPECIES: class I SAM-dependent methyltransferase [Mycobacteriaceae]AHC24330.1 SAM-dependent methyltransferase [Mycolicibacterium neoaurum VKM Ac-1815D]AMO04935.1 SAM-dependent methyltransferase [Mycolicibacterium neoaurum]AXK76753.1 class I SAM-dependent methyltransferase [Mycolicibacterium neoaurum]KJQ52037.1 SAM-dependent methyltransferase [Mycolicibacterium neoaurum]KUM10173.1 SAM-dependent methyltransferase [Mycolicibacterium neoaurum]
MARTDGDTWDLASSVGATATMVAAARAMASSGPAPVIDDPYAAPLVRAVGVDFFTKLVDGEITESELGDDPQMNIARFANGMAARTRFFDDFYADAVGAGVRQAVILAAGLDARAYRLDWPAGTVVFEVDQPEVIEFKTRTLADLGAKPTADRRTVAVDLRDDWVAALRSAGFDPSAPTAWIAEGLFGYLPPEAQDRLLEVITEHSAPGSRLAAEAVPGISEEQQEQARERMQAVRDQWSDHGFDLDFSELVYLGDRTDADTHLVELGWQTSAMTTNALLERYGLPVLDEQAQFGHPSYITAIKQ